MRKRLTSLSRSESLMCWAMKRTDWIAASTSDVSVRGIIICSPSVRRAEKEAKQPSHQENSIRKMPQQILAWLMMMLIGMTHVVVALVVVFVFIWIFRDAVPIMMISGKPFFKQNALKRNYPCSHLMSTSFVWMTSSYSGKVYFVRRIIRTRGINCRKSRFTNGDITWVDDDLKRIKKDLNCCRHNVSSWISWRILILITNYARHTSTTTQTIAYLKWTFNTQTVVQTDSDTKIIVKRRYFPSRGTARDVGGMISASNKKNTVNDTRIEMHSVTWNGSLMGAIRINDAIIEVDCCRVMLAIKRHLWPNLQAQVRDDESLKCNYLFARIWGQIKHQNC